MNASGPVHFESGPSTVIQKSGCVVEQTEYPHKRWLVRGHYGVSFSGGIVAFYEC
jgi:hypothetical protein